MLAIILYAVLFLLATIFVFVAVSVLGGRGAVYVPADRIVVEKMIKIANIKPGDKAVDLGSGDGRIVIALARAGAKAHGYEINPFLVWLSRKNIRKANLSQKAFVHWKSFWGKDLSGFDVVTVYGVNYIMKRLEKKLKKELQTGSRIVSYLFEFSSWPCLIKERSIYLYKK